MRYRRWRWLALAIGLIGVVLGGYHALRWYRWQERPDSVTGVALELRPLSQVIRAGELAVVEAVFINRGNEEVVLVEPGDGSRTGRRTPLIVWSNDPGSWVSMCGNINDLQPEEVFTLKPGESHRVNEWVGKPLLRAPGRYRVAVRYTNRASQQWQGIPFKGHDPIAMQAVRNSTAVDMVSNTIEIVVEK